MNTGRHRRGLVPLITKATEALVKSVEHANKVERGHNFEAAKAFYRSMRDFRNSFSDVLYKKSKDIVKELKQKPKRKVSARQLKALQESRSKIKYNKKENHGI